MLRFPTYAENIRVAAKEMRPHPLTVRDISTATGFSYEHIRQIWIGDTPNRHDEYSKLTISEDGNRVLCELLDLPKDEMWALAEREKYSQKVGYSPMQLPDPIGRQLAQHWEHLSHQQRQMILGMAKGLVGQDEYSMAAKRA